MAQSQRDVIEILTHDHREVEQMFAELEGLRGVTDEQGRTRRKDLVDQATIELVRHSVAEEAEVYPRVKEKVSEAEAERAKQEHAEAEITMKRLESLQPEDPAFDEQLATLMREIREHVAEEEGQMFRHMRTIFSAEELMEMGVRVERVKKMAPTGRTPPHRTSRPATRRSDPSQAFSIGCAMPSLAAAPTTEPDLTPAEPSPNRSPPRRRRIPTRLDAFANRRPATRRVQAHRNDGDRAGCVTGVAWPLSRVVRWLRVGI